MLWRTGEYQRTLAALDQRFHATREGARAAMQWTSVRDAYTFRNYTDHRIQRNKASWWEMKTEKNKSFIGLTWQNPSVATRPMLQKYQERDKLTHRHTQTGIDTYHNKLWDTKWKVINNGDVSTVATGASRIKYLFLMIHCNCIHNLIFLFFKSHLLTFALSIKIQILSDFVRLNIDAQDFVRSC